MAPAETLLWQLNFLATLALLTRFLYSKLHRTYPILFLYWLSQAVADIVLFQIPLRSTVYLYVYSSAQIINLALSVLVVQELYRVALLAHQGISVFGRRGMLAVLGIAAILALAGSGIDSVVLPGQYPWIHLFMAVDRTLEFILLVFLLVISGFLLWFPVKIRRNIAVFITGFVLFYLLQSSAFLLNNLLPQTYSQSISVASLAAALLCLLVWLAGLRAEGASPVIVSGHGWNPAAAARLSVQLDGINAALTRFVRNSASSH
jgi:hypothetical protein